TGSLTLVRQPPVASAVRSDTGSTLISRSIPAMRCSSSVTTGAFSARCAAGRAWAKSQQPAPPGPETGQVLGTRSAEAARISTASARQKLPPVSSVTRARTSSPGSPCRTKTTRPSCLPTQKPPCPGGPSRISKVSPSQSLTRSLPFASSPSVPPPPESPPGYPPPVFPPPRRARPSLPVPEPAPHRTRRVDHPRLLGRDRGTELPGHARHHDARLEQQPALEPQRALIVQHLLPPAADHVLGDEDRHHGARGVPAHPVHVVEHRLGDLAI